MKIDKWQIPLLVMVGVLCVGAYCRYPANTSEAVAAWVQAVGSVGAILVAVWVAYRQYEQTRQLEQNRATAQAASEAGETKAFVQSIRAEISTIWDGYDTGIRPTLRAVPDGGIFDALVPVSTDAFVIYNGSSSRVGKVDDEELRKLIVMTYARARGFIYSLQLNNNLITAFKNFHLMYRGDDREQQLTHQKGVLANYATQLKQRDAELEQHVQTLLTRADSWLRQ
ncbi:hypothetical protein [Paraburkholderia megapolitana]|uniref:hypothetical protein n=1 Tax=Paraburkholderia megapolitana TaxID=420953 RepID=UPI0038B6BB90